MQVMDFISIVRAYLNDSQPPYLWEDDELLSYLVQVLQTIGDEVPFIVVRDTTLSTVADQNEYSFDGVLEVLKVVELTKTDYDRILPDGETGEPRYYAVQGNTLWVYPVPDKEYTFSVVVAPMLYNVTFTDRIEQFRPFFIDGVLWRAYLKNDSETFAPQMAAYYEQMFMRELVKFRQKLILQREPFAVCRAHKGLL